MSNESMLKDAIKEFIEETEIYFRKIEFTNNSFVLKWVDNGLWEYTIFLAFADLSDDNIVFICDKHFMNLNLKFNKKYEPLVVQFLTLEDYVLKMHARLPLYGDNNYVAFFQFLSNIVKEKKIKI